MLVNLTQLDFKGVYMIWLVPSGFQKVLEEANMIQLGEERHMDPQCVARVKVKPCYFELLRGGVVSMKPKLIDSLF